MPNSKFIVIQGTSKFVSKNYSYWQNVIDFIYPILKKERYEIIQVGGPNEVGYKKVTDLRGKTNQNQLAYIIDNASLVASPDSFCAHLASSFDIPLVALHSIITPSEAGAFFGSKDKQILFEAYKRVGNGRPSYSAQENPKSIDLIKPEEIANAIFKLLNIDFNLNLETVHIGKKYGNNIILRELIPNSSSVLNQPNEIVEIRADLFYDEKILAHHLSYLKKAVVITDKSLPLDLLKYFKKNISLIAYIVTENDDIKFIKSLISLGFNVIFLSNLEGEILNDKKFSYYEYGNINKIEKPSKELVENLKKDIDNLYYTSCKFIASGDKVYSSQASINENTVLTTDSEYQKVIDNEKFWNDLDFYHIIKVNKNIDK